MNELLQHLVEALREELRQYGEMLALLDHQQELVMRRQAPDVLKSISAIDAQAEVLHVARGEREQRRRRVAREAKVDEETAFCALLPHLPADYRPLLQALVQENNDLLVRVQQRARQNHMLLSRAVELMQKLLGALVPCPAPGTYNDLGRVPATALPPQSLYNAMG